MIEVIDSEAQWLQGYVGRYAVTREGEVFSFCGSKPKKLNPSPWGGWGHLRVWLYDGKGGREQRFVHHLVLEAFVGPQPEGRVCRHLNGDPADNRVENLRWGTHQENMKDMVEHGNSRDQAGEANVKAELSEEEVVEIRRLYDSGECRNQCELGRRFGVSNSTIHLIVKRKSWRHV